MAVAAIEGSFFWGAHSLVVFDGQVLRAHAVQSDTAFGLAGCSGRSDGNSAGGLSGRLRAFSSSGRTALCHASGSRRLSLPYMFAAARAWKHGASAGVEAFLAGWKFHAALWVVTFGLLILLAQGIPQALPTSLLADRAVKGFSQFARNSHSERPVHRVDQELCAGCRGFSACSTEPLCNMSPKRRPCFPFLGGFVWQA